MYYEELVRRLREHNGWALNETLDEAADAIEELSNAQEQWIEQERNALLKSIPRWIPVTERLPEKFENVLVANKRGKHYDIDKGWWNGSFFDRCAKGSYSNVTHWMSLPEPPKEENHG